MLWKERIVVFTGRGERLLYDIVETIDGVESCYVEALGKSRFDELRSLLGDLRAELSGSIRL